MKSEVIQSGRVDFPEFRNERVYMEEFRVGKGLPLHLKRWQHTVDQMLDDLYVQGRVWIMIDQAYVAAGTHHRRPGLHVDGNWSGRRPAISWLESRRLDADATKPQPEEPGHQRHRNVGGPQMLVMASNVCGCKAYVGSYKRPERFSGGDCAKVDTAGMQTVLMAPNTVWMGPATGMLHKSLPMAEDCARTFVRLNVEDCMSTRVHARRLAPRAGLNQFGAAGPRYRPIQTP